MDSSLNIVIYLVLFIFNVFFLRGQIFSSIMCCCYFCPQGGGGGVGRWVVKTQNSLLMSG